jgi:hypothetical protein
MELSQNYIDNRFRKLKTAKAIYRWKVTPPRLTVAVLFEAILLLIFFILSLVTAFSGDELRLIPASILFVWGISMTLLIRYTENRPSTYEFELTEFGIRFSIHDNSPDFIYKSTRYAAWFGCFLCIIAFLTIGPLAFVGGAAFALMAPKFTQFKKSVHRQSFLVHRYIDFRYYRKQWRVSTQPNYPMEQDWNMISAHRSLQDLYIEPRKLYQLITYLKFNSNLITSAESYSFEEVRNFLSYDKFKELSANQKR